MISPDKCSTIDEVRSAIDSIDNEIITLLGKRFEYVKAVLQFKSNNDESIKAKPRYDAVIKSRMELAEQNGLDGEVIGKIYTELLEYFIEEQKRIINPE